MKWEPGREAHQHRDEGASLEAVCASSRISRMHPDLVVLGDASPSQALRFRILSEQSASGCLAGPRSARSCPRSTFLVGCVEILFLSACTDSAARSCSTCACSAAGACQAQPVRGRALAGTSPRRGWTRGPPPSLCAPSATPSTPAVLWLAGPRTFAHSAQVSRACRNARAGFTKPDMFVFAAPVVTGAPHLRPLRSGFSSLQKCLGEFQPDMLVNLNLVTAGAPAASKRARVPQVCTIHQPSIDIFEVSPPPHHPRKSSSCRVAGVAEKQRLSAPPKSLYCRKLVQCHVINTKRKVLIP